MFVIHIWISVLIIPSFQVGIKGKLCPEAMALTYDRNPEFPVDPRLSTVVFKRKRPVGRPRAPGLALSRTPPRVREDAAYVRTGQEVEHYPRMDLEDINVDEMEEGEITEDEFLEPREAEEEPMGGQEDLGNKMRWVETESSWRQGRQRESRWETRRRCSSSRGDLAGGGATSFGHYWMMPGNDWEECLDIESTSKGTCLG